MVISAIQELLPGGVDPGSQGFNLGEFFEMAIPFGDAPHRKKRYVMGKRYRWNNEKGWVLDIRRRNPLNPKALNRAANRLNAYVKVNKKIEKTLRSLAPRPKSRRDYTKVYPGYKQEVIK